MPVRDATIAHSRCSLSGRLGGAMLLCGIAACTPRGGTLPAATAPRPIADSLATQIDRVFEQFDRADSPGCALGVYDHGVIRYQRGYGMADVTRADPIGATTVFDLASVSKQFVAGLVALLVDDGRVSMDDDVRRWVPELPDFGARLTIGQLVHHTSGLPDNVAYRALAGGGPPATFEAALASIARRPVLNFAPGTASRTQILSTTSFASFSREQRGVQSVSLPPTAFFARSACRLRA